MPAAWVLVAVAFALGFALVAGPMLLAGRLRKDRWAGRKVFLKYPGAQFGQRHPDGTFVPAGVFPGPVVDVAERQGDWLRAWPPGSGTWFPLATAVPLEEAPAYFSGRLRLNPDDVFAWVCRAIAWGELGQTDRALADYAEALRLDPMNALVLYNRGNTWLARQDPDRAVADYTEALRLSPELAAAVYGRGRARELRQDLDGAVADYTEAIRLAPAWVAAYLARGHASFNLKDYDRAVADFTEVIRLEPTCAWAFTGRGHAWLRKLDFDRALADFDEAVRLGPGDPAAHVGRANVWQAKGKYDRAEADCTQALRLDPDHVEAFLIRGLVRAQMGNPLKKRLLAPADFEMAARRAPVGPVRCFCWAAVWQEQKKYHRALAELTEAHRLDPDNYWVLASLAWLEATCPDATYRNGRQAVAHALRAGELTGGNLAPVLGVLAAAHAEAGAFDQAVAYVRQLLEVPDLPADRRALARKQLALYERGQPYRD
jgi:tetratricopeptide (TPR) repeat protein